MNDGTPSFHARYGPWALVAGGSIGLGAEFARQLARRGLDLVLVAEASHPLETFARDLARETGVETRSLVVDLGELQALDRLRERTADLEIGLVVYNAAFSPVGPFLSQSLEDGLKVVDVNCRGPLMLAHAFGRAMARRGRGGLVLLSSLAGWQGTPLVATYAASKAFNLVLGEALWFELRRHGVDVLALCPGATRTPGWESSRASGRGAPVMEPEAVVREALDALGETPSVVAGRANRLASAFLHRLLPRRRAIETMGKSMLAQYPQHSLDRVERAGETSGSE